MKKNTHVLLLLTTTASASAAAHFMEPEGSLPHWQEPTTCPYPEPEQSRPCLLSQFLKIQLSRANEEFMRVSGVVVLRRVKTGKRMRTATKTVCLHDNGPYYQSFTYDVSAAPQGVETRTPNHFSVARFQVFAAVYLTFSLFRIVAQRKLLPTCEIAHWWHLSRFKTSKMGPICSPDLQDFWLTSRCNWGLRFSVITV